MARGPESFASDKKNEKASVDALAGKAKSEIERLGKAGKGTLADAFDGATGLMAMEKILEKPESKRYN